MAKPIFPECTTETFLSFSVLPDELSEMRVQAHCSTPEGLLNYHNTITSFLVSNAHNGYHFTLNGPAFSTLFLRHAQYYADLDSNHITRKLELIRKEQAIHFLADFSYTQDVSSYLKLIEDLCDKEEICELILLLSKKYDVWRDDYSEQYVKWLHFVMPFFEYSQSIMFEAHRILALRDAIPYEMIKAGLIHLKSLFAEKQIKIGLQEDKLGDLEYILGEVLRLKKMLVESDLIRDSHFFYKLGMLSFLLRLIKFCVSQDDSLLKACLLMTLYINIFNDVKNEKGYSPSEILKIAHVRELKNSERWWKGLLKHLCTQLREQAQSLSRQSADMKIFQCLIYAMKHKEAEFSLPDDKLDPQIIEAIDVIYQKHEAYANSESLCSGGYLNHDENCVYDIILLVRVIQKHIVKSHKKLEKIREMLLNLAKNINLGAFIQHKCFDLLKVLIESSTGDKMIPKNWNLAEISLKDLLDSNERINLSYLSISLKHTLKLMKSQATVENNFEESKKDELFTIYNLFIEKVIEGYCNPHSPHRLDILKQIGMFLVGMLTFNLPELDNIKLRFLTVFVDFLMKECQLDCWDIFYLQNYLWDALQGTQGSQKIMERKSFGELFMLIEESAIKNQFKVQSSTQKTGLTHSDHKIRRQMHEIIVKFFKEIEYGVKTLYTSIDFSKTKTDALEKIQSLRLLNKKFLYLTGKEIECQIRITEPDLLNGCELLKTVFKKFIEFCFHPAFVIFSEKSEWKIQEDCYQNIIPKTESEKLTVTWLLRQAFFRNTCQILTEIIKDTRSDTEKSKSYLSALKLKELKYSDLDTHAEDLKDLTHQNLSLLVLLCRGPAFALATTQEEDGQACTLNEQEQAVLEKNVETTLSALAELIVHLVKVTDYTREDEFASIILSIVNMIKATMEQIRNLKRFDYILDKLLSDLFNKCLENSQSKWSDSILNAFHSISSEFNFSNGQSDLKKYYCREGVFTLVVLQIPKLIQKKKKAFYEPQFDAEAVRKIIKVLKESFEIYSSIKETRKYLQRFSNKIPKNREFISNLYFELQNALAGFPILDLLKVEDTQLVEDFKTILQVFEGLFLYVLVKCDNMKSDKNDIEKIQESTKLKNNVVEKFKKIFAPLSYIYEFSHAFEKNYGLELDLIPDAIKEHNSALEELAVKKVEPREDKCDQLFEIDDHFNAIDGSLEDQRDQIFKINDHLNAIYAFRNFREKNSYAPLYEIKSEAHFRDMIIKKQTEYLKSLASMEQEEMNCGSLFRYSLEKLREMIDNTSRLLLEKWLLVYSDSFHCNKVLKDMQKESLEWIELVFKIQVLLQKDTYFRYNDPFEESSNGFWLNNIEKILLVSLWIKQYSVSDYSSLIKTMFSVKKKNPFKQQTVLASAFMFDAFMRSCLPDRMKIEMDIKRAIISTKAWRNPISLADLDGDATIQELEKTHMQSLTQTLSSKFNIYSTCKDIDSENYYSYQNLVITIDASREPTDPTSNIESVLQNMSTNSKAAMDLLIEILLENFLTTITSITTTKSESESKFKETSNIIIVLSTILRRYPQLVCYIVFQKQDYSLVIEKYKQGLVDPESINIEEYKSITVLECLFKIKYFSYNSGDFALLILALITPTGVTFANPDNIPSVLDISVVITNKVIQLINQMIEETCNRKTSSWRSSIEKFMGVQSAINMFSFIWYQARQIYTCRYNEKVFEKYLKDQLLSCLRNILCYLSTIFAEYHDHPEVYKMLIAFLPDQIQYYYDKESEAISVEEIKKSKYSNYQQFLKDYQATGDSEKLKLLCNIIENNAGPNHYPVSQSIPDDILQKTEDIDDSRSWTTLKNLSTPLNSNMDGYLCDAVNGWSSVILALMSNIETFCSYDVNDEEKSVSESVRAYIKWTMDPLTSYRTQKSTLKTMLNERFSNELDALNRDKMEPLPTDTTLRFYNLVSETLKSQNKKKKEEKKEIESVQNIKIEEPVPVPKEMASEQLISEARIKHFKYLELQNKAEFETMQRRMLVQLKLLSEKVLVNSMCAGLNKEETDSLIKETINKEILEQLKNLPEFEKNMYLCLIEQFEVLNSFEYPASFNEIKQEYSWIITTFDQYLSILTCLRGGPLQKPQSDEYIENADSEIIFPNEYHFQANSNIVDKAPEKIVSFMKNLFIVDDSVVESVIKGFYITKENSEEDTNQPLVSSLCHSALFEAQVIDYCFFFLYSHDHLDLVKQQGGHKFLSASVCNQERYWMTNTYSVVACNILCFLKDVLKNREYLLQQPRLYFEQHGLQSLKELKAQTQFYKNTLRMISLADLLVGLLGLKEMQADARLQIALQELIFETFSRNKQFKMIEMNAGDEMIEGKNVLNRENCRRLMQVENFEKLIEIIMDFIPYELESILQKTIHQQEIISSGLEDVGSTLKILPSPDKKGPSAPKVDAMMIYDYEVELGGLEKSLSMLSYLMSSWILEGNDSNQCDQENKNELFKENFKMIHYRILENEKMYNLMTSILRLASYLPTREEFKDAKPKSLLFVMFNICVHYFVLICVQHEVLSRDSTDSQDKFEGIEIEFSPSIKEKQKDLEDLFNVMYKANLKNARDSVSEESNSYGALVKGVQVISQKFSWLLLDLEGKKKRLLEHIEKDIGDTRDISINREALVKSTLAAFANKPPQNLKRDVEVEFLNEPGVDGGGLTREWLTIINRELFNPQTGLFQLTEDNVSLQISPLAKTVPSHLKYLQLAGMMLAKAMQLQSVVDVVLSDCLLKHILGRRIILNDLKAVDSSLAKSLEWILENPSDDLDQYFTYETKIFGQRVTKDLTPNGYNTLVTDSNKQEFVRRMCEAKLKGDIQEEIGVFLRGFYLIIPQHFLKELCPSELQMLISGPSIIDLNDIKAIAMYSASFEQDSEMIQWLWEVLASFNQTELSAFLLFATGNSKVPYGGFKEKSFEFRINTEDLNSLPTAGTCYWNIEMPRYSSKEELRNKLLYAILEGQGSFMFA